MTEQVHKRLIDEQVKMILDRFIRKELSSNQAMELLGLKRSQFFEWVKRDRERKEGFSIHGGIPYLGDPIGPLKVKDVLLSEFPDSPKLLNK